MQKQVAEIIEVDPFTVLNWETDATNPKFRFLPTIIRFLGYNPIPVLPDALLHIRLKTCRQRLGLSQEKLAKLFKVNESTVQEWEAGKAKPCNKSLKIIDSFLSKNS